MKSIYMKRKNLRELIDCGDTVVTACRRFIAEHPERYTIFGNVGNLTNVLAFVDALKFYKSENTALPPFRPERIAAMLGITERRKSK